LERGTAEKTNRRGDAGKPKDWQLDKVRHQFEEETA